MNILEEYSSVISESGATKKLFIGGRNESYAVYRIPLDLLFYNDQNDRIATWINEYLSNGNSLSPYGDRNEYNDIIEHFIVESNPDAIKKTKENINLIDQQEPGVVLQDGRVVDGNRRFTCLRLLNKENPTKFQYFEAVVLDKDIEKNKKQIKLLELQLQHGMESRIDYDPIDKLVGMYNDIIENKLITKEEYAESTNSTLTNVEKKCDEACLMVEFLDYIGSKGKYYIARDMKLDGPLVELQGVLRRTTEEKRDDVKNGVFNMLALQAGKDMTREVRRLKKVVNYDKYLDNYINEQQEIAEKLLTAIDGTDNPISVLAKQDRLREEAKRS